MTEEHLRRIYAKTRGHCHFCGDPVDFDKRGWQDGDLTGYWEVDHIIQKHKGGSSDEANCLPACTRCNRLRWHRSGAELRELLLLGLVARAEITKRTATGRRLQELHKQRLQTNRRRRKGFHAPANQSPLAPPKGTEEA